jgi:cellulose synthase/poly-beta-1,6-N-acetylglucosamine synthase-like glycosyltransferase
MTRALATIFLWTSILVWLSTFGYLLILKVIVALRKQPVLPLSTYPRITVVVPTLNEEATIAGKLDDLKRCDYPSDRKSFLVVDGGSTDRTTKLVREEISAGANVELICLHDAAGKADQVNHALKHVEDGIIVFTDADSQLERSCVRELVRSLVNGRTTTLAGAVVEPQSRLLEEHIHWCFLNDLWWLEGEVFSCAGLSGVCYAVNRDVLLSLQKDAQAEDIHLGLVASARGMRVRIAREAVARELRVPQTVGEFLQFRRRRGASYLNEILHFQHPAEAPARWRLARFIRLWQFVGVPWLGGAAVVMAALLLATASWPLVPVVASAFIVPCLSYARPRRGRPGGGPRWPKLALAACRYPFLFLMSLLTLAKRPSELGAVGGTR